MSAHWPTLGTLAVALIFALWCGFGDLIYNALSGPREKRRGGEKELDKGVGVLKSGEALQEVSSVKRLASSQREEID